MKVRVRGLVLALFIALAGAYVGAFAAERIAVEHVPPLPSGAEAQSLSATAFPGLRVFGGGDAPAIEPFGDGEGVKYGSVAYWVKHTEDTRDVATYAAGVRDRLAAAGWQIHDFAVADPESLVDGGVEYQAGFRATKPGLNLYFSDYYWTGRPSYDSPGAAAFDLWRTPPPWSGTAGWAGAAVGALVALLLTWWVARHAGQARPFAAVAAVAAVVFLLPSTLRPGEEVPGDSPWWGGFYNLGYGPALLSALLVGLILVVTVAQTRPVRAALGFGATAVRRWPKTAVAGLVLVALAFVLPGALRQTGVTGPDCRPAGLPAEASAAETRTSKHVKIFVDNAATEQERALIDAAIFRSRSGSLGELIWQPDSAGFRDTYCAGGPVPAEAVAALPYYFDVELANPAYLPALTEEVNGLAGVLAVHRTP
ncbi:hypothetical protein M1L60_00420 [Actinoplanes sp. TRM 88003]|uniref:Uncharacterized protein n=1 Tax=Paractinoplanes aksuensis TaxID=2939490 RepID=A0ABT1DE06_9ACTN|nr:hypothetical protein [Actinoplanes aksuensis]MCO8269047.1 hypothetical protein [Actinoplanes aksuensis]